MFALSDFALWILFAVSASAILIVDFVFLARDKKRLSPRKALAIVAVYELVALAFGALIFLSRGSGSGMEYLAGLLIEQSLSFDNVFVWAVIFGFFAVPAAYHRRVLFWGIFGALVFRAIFIFAGVALLERFSWIEIIFGAFLVITALRIAFHDETEIDPNHNPIFRLARRIVPDGVLLLGGAESVFGLSDAFAGIAGLKGVYGHADRIKPAPVVRPSLQLPAAS